MYTSSEAGWTSCGHWTIIGFGWYLKLGIGKFQFYPNHGRMNYKDTKPYMSAFLSVDLLTDFAAFCLTDFIDWRYIHSWFVFSIQLVNCCPHGRRNYTCVLLPLYYTVPSLWPPPPSPLPNIQYIQTVCDCGGEGWGAVEMYCGFKVPTSMIPIHRFFLA